MTGHSHPCHSCPTRGAQVQPWRREGSGRMDRTGRRGPWARVGQGCGEQQRREGGVHRC